MADLALIKSNVAKMAAQNAPPADIDGYISQQGVSVDDVKNFNPNAVSKTESFGKGALYGAVNEPIDTVGAGLATLAVGGPNKWDSFKQNLSDAKADSLAKAGAAYTDNPRTFGLGQIAGNIGASILPAEGAVGAISGATKLAGLPSAAEFLAGAGGLTSGATRGAIEGAASSSMLGQDPRYGAGGGAIGNVATKFLGRLAQPIDQPSTIRKGMVDSLENEGVTDITPAQRSGSRALENLEASFSTLPFTGAVQKELVDKQGKQFTSAVLKKAGLNGNIADEGSLTQIANNLGQKFDDVASQTTIPVRGNQDLQDALLSIRQKYSTGLEPDQKSVVYDYLNYIGQKDELPGKVYQQTRSSLGAKAAGASDPYFKDVLMDIQGALDSAAKNHMTPENAKTWDEANKGYRNFLTIQKAMKSNAGIESEGNIPYQALLTAARAQQGDKFARGSGDLNSIARAGVNVLKNSVPDSGSAGRIYTQNALTGLGGFGLGFATGGDNNPDNGYDIGDRVSGGLEYGIGSLLAPQAIQKLYMSPAGRAYLEKGIPYASDLLKSDTGRTIGSLMGASNMNDNPKPLLIEVRPNDRNRR